jgi:hypothetical protein
LGIRRRKREDISDIHQQASPLNYLNFTTSNSRAYQGCEPFGMSIADLYTDVMGINSSDNFIVPPYSSGRNNSNGGNGPNKQSGGFSGLPPGEYSTIYRSLNYSHPVEADTGKQLTDLQSSTILRFTVISLEGN